MAASEAAGADAAGADAAGADAAGLLDAPGVEQAAARIATAARPTKNLRVGGVIIRSPPCARRTDLVASMD
jgi:hypothetical protein